MDLREYARTETAALVERLLTASEEAAQKARAQVEHEVAAIRARAEAVQSELEIEAARAAALEADLDAVIEAHRQVDAERAAAETARAAAEAALTDTEQDLQQARQAIEASRAEASRVAVALEDETEHNRVLKEELAAARGLLETLQAAREAADAENQLAHDEEIRAARDTIQSLEGRIESIRSERAALEEARAAEAAARTRAEEQTGSVRGELETTQDALRAAQEELRTSQEMLDATHRHHEEQAAALAEVQDRLREADARAEGTLAATVRGFTALNGAATVSELFETLVKQVAAELPRVALFRVKDNHVVGEHAAGVDPGVDIAKLMIPMSVDSVITRAIPHGGLVRADGAEFAATFRPFSGTAASAIAVPVNFQGETLAVLYGDADIAVTQAQATLALLLAGHAGVLLSRLAQELKALKELREYAAMLLQEAEQMFLSDTQAARPAHECIRRLQETVECGRQLYAQRAALEGAVAAGLLDEQIASIIHAQQTAFADALAAATVSHPEAHRTAS